MAAGHDTTATTLAFALWALGHHPDVQDRVAGEAAAIGDRELAPDDVPRLAYTVQVLREALRLCPPVSVAGLERPCGTSSSRLPDRGGQQVLVGIYGMQRDRSDGRTR